MVQIGSLFVITQSDFYATFQRLQGKVICLLSTGSDLGKQLLVDLHTVSVTAKVVVFRSASDDHWVVTLLPDGNILIALVFKHHVT